MLIRVSRFRRPDLLAMPLAVEAAKARAEERRRLEAVIPKGMMFVKGRPTAMPDWDDATVLANVRKKISDLMGFNCRYTKPVEILDRYAELLEEQTVSPITLAA